MSASPYCCSPHTAHSLLETADWVEQAALHDMFLAAPAGLRQSAGLFVERVAGALTIGAPGLSSTMTNRVFVQPGASPEAAGAAIDRMRRAGVRHYFAHVHRPASDELTAALTERGLSRYHRAWLKLARDRSPMAQHAASAPDGFELIAAKREQADAFADIVVRCMHIDPMLAELLACVVQRPRWHVYFAQQDGRPLATGALFVQGDVAYLSYGATLPEHRGQGLQRMLLAKRMRVALALGCRHIISETGEALPDQKNPSQDNMVSLGMRPVALRDNYVLNGVSWG